LKASTEFWKLYYDQLLRRHESMPPRVALSDKLSDTTSPSLVLSIHRKLLQRLQVHPLQCPLIRSRQHNFRDLLIIITRPVLKRLLPAIHTQTPLAAALEPGITQIISLCGAVVQELFCHDASDAVVAEV
jgi:hypothetical protein